MRKLAFLFVICFATSSAAQLSDQLAPGVSAALTRWKAAVLAGDKPAIEKLYSPQAQLQDVKRQPIAAADNLAFWSSQKSSGLHALKLDVVKIEPPQNGIQALKFQVELKEGAKTRYIVAVQGWRVQDSAVIIAETRTDLLGLKQPVKLNPNLYNVSADAKGEIHEAEQRAVHEHKRVLLVFGGNWCYDCHVLDLAFHSGDIEPTLDRNFEVVHVNIGEYDKNLDIAEKYQVPLKKGVPAIAVVDGSDRLLFSQQAGEFENARTLSPEPILAFLNKWKPAR